MLARVTSRTSRRAPALLLVGLILAALTLLLLTLAPMVGQPRRVVAVVVIGIVFDAGLYLVLRREPTLSPRLREVVGLVVLGVFVVALYGLIVWAGTVRLIEGRMGVVALILSPWALVIVAGVVALADRRRGRRRSFAIDPVRLIVIAAVATAAWFNGGQYEVWTTFRREPGTVAASVLTLSIAAVLIVSSRLRPGWLEGRPAFAVRQTGADSIAEPDRTPTAGVTEAVAAGPTWLEYLVMGVAIIVVLFFSMSFMNNGHVSKILRPIESYPPVAPSY